MRSMLLVTLVFAISLFALEFFTQAQPPVDEKIKAVVQEGFFLGYKLKRGEPSPRLKKVLTRIVQVNLDEILAAMSESEKQALLKPVNLLTEKDEKAYQAFSSELNRRIFFATIWVNPYLLER